MLLFGAAPAQDGTHGTRRRAHARPTRHERHMRVLGCRTKKGLGAIPPATIAARDVDSRTIRRWLGEALTRPDDQVAFGL
jgi:hypothetical protein